MIKRYKRSNSGYLRRSSRVYLNSLNKNKASCLYDFCQDYANVIRYYVEMFWSTKSFTDILADKEITSRAVKQFNITARLSQLAAKQAREIVNSQRKKSRQKQRMPKFRNVSVNLDQRFFDLSEFNGSFDWALKFSSGVPAIIVPFNNTRHTNKFLKNNWTLSKSIRLGIREGKLWIDLIFEKSRPEPKASGEIIGVDLGYRVPIATSDKQLIGTELKDKIQKTDKKRKKFHYYIQTETNRLIKSIDLTNVKTIVIENLKNVKKGKRGKFSRRVNRLLSFWLYARVTERLKQLCEELEINILLKSPWKTSQRCPLCGKIDKRNRKGDKFKCIGCGFEEHSDIVGALNLKALGLAGVYSLGSLPS